MDASVFWTSDAPLYNVQINALADDPKILHDDDVSSIPPLVMSLAASGTNKRLVFVRHDLNVNLLFCLG
jgi:hypothetical protein